MPHAYTTDGRRQASAQAAAAGHARRRHRGDGDAQQSLSLPARPLRARLHDRALPQDQKPKSKLVILDPKKAFSKQPVFIEAFDKHYKGIIELNLTTEIDDYSVVSVDPKTKEIVTKAGKRVKADVANIIPQQRAGEIAVKAGCTEGDWCPINPDNFASKKVQDVYVLGDAAIAAEMPKSAFSANSQAKVVAADILADARQEGEVPGRAIATPAGRCWRPTTTSRSAPTMRPRTASSILPAGSCRSGARPPTCASRTITESIAWYDGITADMFAKTSAAATEEGRVASRSDFARSLPIMKRRSVPAGQAEPFDLAWHTGQSYLLGFLSVDGMSFFAGFGTEAKYAASACTCSSLSDLRRTP